MKGLSKFMKLACYGCDAKKDMDQEEIYPYPEDDKLTSEPIPPLMVVECLVRNPANYTEGIYKAVIICHHCFKKLDPDLWISERCWDSINPRVPLENLPKMAEINQWRPETYPIL